MKMDLGFTVIANCISIEAIEKINDGSDYRSMEITLHFDIDTAKMFATKLGPNSFEIPVGEDYHEAKIIFSRKSSDPDYLAILLSVDRDMYIIKNPHQILRDVLEGYTKLITLDKIASIIDFDFDAGIELQK